MVGVEDDWAAAAVRQAIATPAQPTPTSVRMPAISATLTVSIPSGAISPAGRCPSFSPVHGACPAERVIGPPLTAGRTNERQPSAPFTGLPRCTGLSPSDV